MKKKFIAIDVGRNEVKATNGIEEINFKAQVGEWRKRNIGKKGNYEVEIDSHKLFVADLASESRFARENAEKSKVHEESKFLFLTALALLANPKDELIITTSLPIEHHTDEIKEDFSRLLQGVHTVTVNGKQGVYAIKEPNIAPEGACAVWDEILNDLGEVEHMELLQGITRVIDIGSRTINYGTLKNGDYFDRESGTLDYGTIDLYNETEEPDESIKRFFCRRVVADLSKKWLTYKPGNDKILLVGGGSILLDHHLLSMFQNSRQAKNPLFATVRGARKMAIAQYA